MPSTTEPPAVVDTPPAAPARTRLKPSERTKPKLQPPYAVVLHNDNVNRFEWVTGVLMRVLRCGRARAIWLTLKAHVSGRGIIWSGSLEVAELKAEQVRAYGPDPVKRAAGAHPLRVSIEPLPV